MKKHIIIASVLIALVLPISADQIFEYGDVTVTVHETPILDLASRAQPPKRRKIDVAGDWLVLPRFEADTNSVDGVNTFFAVRNTTDTARDVTLRYHSDNQVGTPIAETVSLGPKQVRSFSLRNVVGLQTDGAGFARGFVDIIEEDAIDLIPKSVIQGDYFLIDSANNFASGDRLLNYTGLFAFNDLCQKFEVRFFNGGDFDGGTTLTFFVEQLQPNNEFLYSVYEEAGGLPVRTGGVSLESGRSVNLPASFLAGPTNFGVIEIVFTGTVGHVSGVFSALGKFSVGVNGLCEGPSVSE